AVDPTGARSCDHVHEHRLAEDLEQLAVAPRRRSACELLLAGDGRAADAVDLVRHAADPDCEADAAVHDEAEAHLADGLPRLPWASSSGGCLGSLDRRVCGVPHAVPDPTEHRTS